MKSWNVNDLELQAHAPQILSSSDDARLIALSIPAGESLQDHQVHERAWVMVVDGEVQIDTPSAETLTGGPGLLLGFAPGERHAVHALTSARLLLLLTPWPGDGHPGTMTLADKATVRQRAAEQRSGT